MNTKGFLLLLLGVLVLGGSLGGAFAGGVALGKAQQDEQTSPAPAVSLASGATQSLARGADGGGLPSGDQLARLLSEGNLDQATIDRIRQQFQDRLTQSAGNRRGLSGPIDRIDGNTLTVNTSAGPLEAVVDADTTIRMLKDGALADLTQGLRVIVVGDRLDDGTVRASSITVVPEGAGNFLGGFRGAGFGGRRGGRFGGGGGPQVGTPPAD